MLLAYALIVLMDSFVMVRSSYLLLWLYDMQVLRRFFKIDNELREPVTKEEIVSEVCSLS